MNLPQETIGAWQWYGRILRVFLKTQTSTTLAVIIASLVSRITMLLAFFLPLKVILLAGSSGVPRYFPFIDPDDKMAWIIGLTLGAFLCYAITLAMEALSRRWSEAGSAEVIQGANEMVFLKNQQAEGQSYYSDFCQIAANVLFVALGLVVLALLDGWLFSILAGLLVLQYALSAWILRGSDDLPPGRFRRFIQEGLGNYLITLSSINFFTGFLVILTPFLVTGAGNILVAILSIVLIRQVLTSLVAMVKELTGLGKDRSIINALVFREHQLAKAEPPLGRKLRDLFHKEARRQRVQRELANIGRPEESVDVRWMDSAIRGVSTFVISAGVGSGDGSGRHYLLQVFPPKYLKQLENETFLLRNISREAIKAPEVFSRFTEGPFLCQLYDYGDGEAVPATEWQDWQQRLLEHSWSCPPPRSIVDAFTASHPLLHERLSDELTGRLAVALDTEQENAVYEEFRTLLPSLRDRIAATPLYIHNPDLNRYNVVRAGDDVRVMTWGRWSLEPVGARLPRVIGEQRLSAMLERVSGARAGIPEDLTVNKLMLLSQCQELETEIQRGSYKTALRLIARIVKSPVVYPCRDYGT